MQTNLHKRESLSAHILVAKLDFLSKSCLVPATFDCQSWLHHRAEIQGFPCHLRIVRAQIVLIKCLPGIHYSLSDCLVHLFLNRA
jgi:hypothetical protein